MRSPLTSRFPVAAFAVAAMFFTVQTPSYALLDFIFGKKDKVAPTADERTVQEQAAQGLLSQGLAAQQAGKTGRAKGYYERIVKQYPFTQAAGEAAYQKAVIVRHTENDLEEAFNAFQEFVDNHRQSPRFAEAIERQFEIAEEAKGGKKQRSILLLPMKMNPSDILAFYEKIIENAPYGKFAALSQFSIAEMQQDLREKDKAVQAYQKVVDNYPGTSQASEAQFRIASISNVAAQRSEDASNLTATRDALKTYMATNPGGDRKQEAEQILRQVNTAEANQSLSIAKFYRTQGKTVAAAMYLNEAIKFGSPEVSAEARELLAELAAEDPDGVSQSRRGQPDQDFTKLASKDLKSRPDYVGPMAPELARLAEKPRMRSGNDSFMPIPLTEPALPLQPGGANQAPGSLLPSLPQMEKPAVLPVPPAPAAPGSTPPVPPAPKPAS